MNALQPRTTGVTYRAAGLGSADSVAPNTKTDGSDNPEGRALNRRVTISFAVKVPVSNGAGAAVASYLNASADNFLGSSYTVWAYFPAPVGAVSTVTVVLPGGLACVEDVPVAASAP